MLASTENTYRYVRCTQGCVQVVMLLLAHLTEKHWASMFKLVRNLIKTILQFKTRGQAEIRAARRRWRHILPGLDLVLL